MIGRRSIIKVFAGILAAPAIVRASSLMPISAPAFVEDLGWTGELFFRGGMTAFDDPRATGAYMLRGDLAAMISANNALYARLKVMSS